jgi:hypothetical protein
MHSTYSAGGAVIGAVILLALYQALFRRRMRRFRRAGSAALATPCATLSGFLTRP